MKRADFDVLLRKLTSDEDTSRSAVLALFSARLTDAQAAAFKRRLGTAEYVLTLSARDCLDVLTVETRPECIPELRAAHTRMGKHLAFLRDAISRA